MWMDKIQIDDVVKALEIIGDINYNHDSLTLVLFYECR